MKVTQIATIMNTVTSEILGKTDVVAEDLSNIVSVGKEILDTTDVDNYVRKLIDHIGRVIFVDRVYRGTAPSVLMDNWEYGSVLEKITVELPEAEENETWNLQDGHTYAQDVFTAPKVSAKFFNGKVTFEIPMSFTELQVKSSFSSPSQLNSFMSMLYNAVNKSMTVKLDSLIARTINNFAAVTLSEAFSDGNYGSGATTRAVNLLYLYNQKYPDKPLKASDCVTNPDFIRFASYTMGMYIERLSKISSLFNIGGFDRFTSSDVLHIIMLADFEKAAMTYLQSSTFHDELVALPKHETVPYWQGSGTDYSFDSVSSIHVTANDGEASSGVEVQASGILAVMFDRDALGVSNLNQRVTSHYNARAEFFNNWYKADSGYFNDFNENFVVFYVMDDNE